MAEYINNIVVQDRYGVDLPINTRFDDTRLPALTLKKLLGTGDVVLAPVELYLPIPFKPTYVPHGSGGAGGTEFDPIATSLVQQIVKSGGDVIAPGDEFSAANRLWKHTGTANLALPANPTLTNLRALTDLTEITSALVDEVLYVTTDIVGDTVPAGADKAVRITPYTEYFNNGGVWEAEVAGNAIVSDDVTLATLPADTVTNVPASTIIPDPRDIVVYDNNMRRITGSVITGKTGTTFTLLSSVAMTNLTIRVFA